MRSRPPPRRQRRDEAANLQTRVCVGSLYYTRAIFHGFYELLSLHVTGIPFYCFPEEDRETLSCKIGFSKLS